MRRTTMMRDGTRRIASRPFWEELERLPFGMQASVMELAEACPPVFRNGSEDYEIAGGEVSMTSGIWPCW